MSSNYGRNFEFRVPPQPEHRLGRFISPSTGDRIPIGAPVAANYGADDNALQVQEVQLATAGTALRAGESGVAVFEYGPYWWEGVDAQLTTWSDMDTVPLAKQLQVVHGNEVKFVLRNTADREFLTLRNYTGRTMVAGLGATPTLAEGDFLEPHATPSDTNGYWQETATEADAWAVITKVDTARSEVEAVMVR